MGTQKTTKLPEENTPEEGQDKKQGTNDQVSAKSDKKTKKKHNSALVAMSHARSAVENAGAHAYRDGGFAKTGSNLSYREEDGEI
jgi:hypothetical protein